jgi:HD-GYP domain-containing protein (c-di-GMP phosphodiesterase class II)
MLELTLSNAVMIPLAMLQCMEGLDPVVFKHGARVGHYAKLMGEVMGLSEAALNRLELAARLHDIGKLFIPSFLVHKQATFNREEYRIMQRHTMLGARLLEGHPETSDLAEVARHHHDRWDGGPEAAHGLPLLTRITSVADAYDAMTSNRYGGSRCHDAAIGEILRCRGTQFCPEAVDAFLLAESRSWARMAS